ncbi:unnamed protein product [Rotaria sordida]|uniref:Uncharacterized protein n=1 Tax=Rotaria sordida TaxID=392033 RepID=A0A815H637_9BILA|nr:unnamed protein product [Rotaria sordida]
MYSNYARKFNADSKSVILFEKYWWRKNGLNATCPLQERHISDLLYYTPFRTRSSLQLVGEKTKSYSSFQPTLLTTMSTPQSTSELVEEQKTCDRMLQLEIKSNLQLLREQEKIALQSINKLTEEEMVHID